MKILITGASGGIGKILIKKLIETELYDLVILSRKMLARENTDKLKIVFGDLNDPASLDKALKNIDIVIHLAGVTHSNNAKKYFQINTEGTKNLLLAAENNSVKKFIYISSRAAIKTGGAYAYSKFLAEEAVKKYKYDWIILKPAEIYGANDNDALQKLIEKIKKSYLIPVPGKGESELSPVFIDDIIAAIINSISTEKNNTSFVLAGPKNLSYKDLVDLIARSFNKTIKIIYIPIFVLKITALIFPRLLAKDQIPRLLSDKPKDISLARAYLDYNPCSIEEKIKTSIDPISEKNDIKKNLFNKINFFWWLGVFVFILAIHSFHRLDSDEGLVLSIAWGIHNGKLLYKDIFEFVAPGSFYLIAGIWKIFGVNYFIANFTSAAAIFLSAYGLFRISFTLTKNKFAYVASLFFLISSIYWPIISYHTFNLLFLIWAVYFSLKSLNCKKYIYPLLSGLFFGLAIIFLQHTGLAIFGAAALFFLLLALIEKNFFRLKQLSTLAVSAFLIVGSLFLKWPPALLFKNLIIFPFSNYQESASVPYGLIYIFLCFLVFIFYLLKNEKKLEHYFIFYIQIILLLSTYSLADHFHVTKFLFPIYALMPLAISSIKLKKFFLQIAFYFFTCALALIIIAPSLISLRYSQFFNYNNDNKVITRAQELCAGSEYIYAGPFLSGFYFEMRKKNPSPHYWLITNHHTEGQFNEALEGLKKYRPNCAILNYNMVKKYRYNQNNMLDKYIFNNYNYIESINSIMFYQKK